MEAVPLAGLNPRREIDWFKQWGPPRGAFVDNETVFVDAGVTLPVDLPHLSAQYHSLTSSDAVKGIEVNKPLRRRCPARASRRGCGSTRAARSAREIGP